MADWKDVIRARAAADAALHGVPATAKLDLSGDGLALVMAARAVCLELRALATLIDHALRETR